MRSCTPPAPQPAALSSQVDLVVCFESVASPVRLVQRLGRTGRKRAGRCVLLMTEAERTKYDQTRRQALHVAEAVRCGSRLSLRPTTPVLPAAMTRPHPHALPCAYWEVPPPPPPPPQQQQQQQHRRRRNRKRNEWVEPAAEEENERRRSGHD